MKNIYRFIRLPFGGFVPLGFLFVVFCLFAITNPLRAQWIQTNGPSGVSSTNCLAVSGTNLFAGTNKGVFLTTDNGTTWSAVNTGLPTNTTVNALAIGGTNIFAGTSNGVYLSTNNATNWSAVNTGFPFIPTVSAFAIDGINIFAGTSNGVYLSTDNGTSWTSTHSNPIFTIALVVNGMDLFAANGTGVSYSTDNGTSWTAVNTGLTNTSVKSLAVSGTNLFTGTLGGGVFLSTNNGTSWVPAGTGLPTDDGVYALAVSPDGAGGTNLFAGTLGGGVFFFNQQRYKLGCGQSGIERFSYLFTNCEQREPFCRNWKWFRPCMANSSFIFFCSVKTNFEFPIQWCVESTAFSNDLLGWGLGCFQLPPTSLKRFIIHVS